MRKPKIAHEIMASLSYPTFQLLKGRLSQLSFCRNVEIEQVDYLDEAVLPYVISLYFQEKDKKALTDQFDKFCTAFGLYYLPTFTDDDTGTASVVVELIAVPPQETCLEDGCRALPIDSDSNLCSLHKFFDEEEDESC